MVFNKLFGKLCIWVMCDLFIIGVECICFFLGVKFNYSVYWYLKLFIKLKVNCYLGKKFGWFYY